MSYMRFAKMHGAGNDFIVVDQTLSVRKFTPERVKRLCDRHKGIGGDGLILLSRGSMPGQENTVRMEFYNCDGSRASLCGNGLRCAAAFAYQKCLAEGPDIAFATGCGVLHTRVLGENRVRIELPHSGDGFKEYKNLGPFTAYAGSVGVPHAIVFVPDLETFDVATAGAFIRNHDVFQREGTNADFLPEKYDLTRPIPIRTYERGVEGETPACGTGAGSAAVVLRQRHPELKKVSFLTHSGDILELEFPEEWNSGKCVYLTGPAEESFHGATDAFDLE